MSDVKSQLRITAWPGSPLPLPDAVKLKSKLDLNEGVIVPCVDREGSWVDEEPVRLSGETYLRLAEVDLDDPESIFAFVSTYGPLGGADAYSLVEQHPVLLFLHGQELDLVQEETKKERALLAEMSRAAGLDQREVDEVGSPHDFYRSGRSMNSDLNRVFTHHAETIDEFRFAAHCIGYLTAAWQAIRQGIDFPDYKWGTLELPPDLEKLKLTGELLVGALPSFLYPFSPQLEVKWTGDWPPSDLNREVSVEPRRGPTRVHLYTICALELFNHIVADAEYHICANERCQRTFVHQEGRSEKGQRRSRGVLYCTAACARATAQREYRRRRLKSEDA